MSIKEMNKKINIDHLSRVEGHGGITVELEGRRVKDVQMKIFEGSRFLEGLVKRKHYKEVATLVSRVCAICSGVHTVTAQMAVEDAFGVAITPRTRNLRGLLIQGGNIESHALHLFCLVLPDFMGYPSVLDLAKDHKDVVRLGLSIKELGNNIQDVVGGRAVHPVNVLIGRFGRLPLREQLEKIQERLDWALQEMPKVLNLYKSLTLPDIPKSKDTVYMALKPEKRPYGFFGKTIQVSNGDTYSYTDFNKVCHERVVSHSHAKQSLYSNKPFMVGSQARLAIFGDKIGGMAEEVLKSFYKNTKEIGDGNPLNNNLGQLVELIHALEQSKKYIDEIFSLGFEEERAPEVKPSKGRGVGASEAPRGTLYHNYVFDSKGYVVDADIITPTAQNLANIELDMRRASEYYLDKGADEKDLKEILEMISRAYDPCISCSVHVVQLSK